MRFFLGETYEMLYETCVRQAVVVESRMGGQRATLRFLDGNDSCEAESTELIELADAGGEPIRIARLACNTEPRCAVVMFPRLSLNSEGRTPLIAPRGVAGTA